MGSRGSKDHPNPLWDAVYHGIDGYMHPDGHSSDTGRRKSKRNKRSKSAAKRSRSRSNSCDRRYGSFSSLNSCDIPEYVHIPIPVKKCPVPVPVPQPYPVRVPVPQPYPVQVPVDRPYPVEVRVPQPYPVEVRVPVPQPYPVEVRVPVPEPVPVCEPPPPMPCLPSPCRYGIHRPRRHRNYYYKKISIL